MPVRVRSFCLLTFALASLAALALPPAVHAASAVHGRRVRAAADCAAALRIALPNAHITAASAVPSNDSLRALGQKPYCRVEAPSRIIARKLRSTQVERTHPLCAYPMTARYNGTGSTDDAAAFTCR